MKTLLLSIPYGMSARNFLRSEFYTLLREKIKIVIVTPLAEDPNFLTEFSHPHVEFVNIPKRWSKMLGLVSRLNHIIQTALFTEKHPIETLMFLKKKLKKISPVRYGFAMLLLKTWGQIPFLVKVLEKLYYKLSINPQIELLFDEKSIDLVFLTHGFIQEEMEMALVAKKRGVKVVNMIHSWDNLTSKSGFCQMTSVDVGRLWIEKFVDTAIVWNEIMAQELMELYDFPKEKIFISGIPQFDIYARKDHLTPRISFFSSYGMDPNKKVILFAVTSSVLIHDQTVVVKSILEAMNKGTLSHPAQLLVRFHPKSDMKNWVDLFKGPNVFFQHPSAAFEAFTVQKGWRVDDSSKNELADALVNSDVLINGMSTTSIDAAVFDKPVICIGFDGDASNQPTVPQYYRNTHYAQLVALEGLRIAWTPEELLGHLNIYLNHPETDAAGRQRIRDKECFKVDGGTGRRLADFLYAKISN